jgi:type II secretory pathway component GspD/PulD (secretin)
MVDLSQANQRGIDALFQDLEWENDAETRTETITATNEGVPIAGSEQTVTYETGAKTLKGGLKVPLLNSSLEFDLENWKIKNIKWNQIFSLASQRDDVRIFSTPSLTVSHGGKGAGEDGGSSDSKIVITDTRTIGLPSVNYGDNQRSDSGLKDRTARTELHIANPRIRKTVRDNRGNIIERGTVFVSVTVTAEKFDTTNVNTYEGQSLPSIRGRTAQTDLAIRDGQIMVLGGFREIQMDSTSSKYNLLSDIPYFGEKLFSPSQTKSTPSELMIFIRPSIIDPENPSDDRTSQNTSTIDDLMNPKYTPMFVAPSGKILGVPDQENMISPQDKPSVKPSL